MNSRLSISFPHSQECSRLKIITFFPQNIKNKKKEKQTVPMKELLNSFHLWSHSGDTYLQCNIHPHAILLRDTPGK